MPSINKCLVLLALTLSTASALTRNGHIARSNGHNDLAARNVVADTHLVKKDNNIVREASLRRRASNSARCKSRPKSSSSSSSSHTSHTSHKAEATPAKAVAADPPKSSSHSEKKVAPPKTTSSAHKAVATEKASASSGGSSSGDSGLGGILQSYSDGVATFFFQHGTAGACGQVHDDNDLIVALYTSVYDNGAHCGKQVKLTNTDSGKTAMATVADECPSCKKPGSIDCSQGLANALGITVQLGEVPIKYEILS